MTDKEKEDKYAVVADGEVVDTEPTKAKANKAAKELETENVEVVPVEEVREAKAKTRRAGDAQGIPHLR